MILSVKWMAINTYKTHLVSTIGSISFDIVSFVLVVSSTSFQRIIYSITTTFICPTIRLAMGSWLFLTLNV